MVRLLCPIFIKYDEKLHAKVLYCPNCNEELVGEVTPSNSIIGRVLWECNNCNWHLTGKSAEELYFLFIQDLI